MLIMIRKWDIYRKGTYNLF